MIYLRLAALVMALLPGCSASVKERQDGKRQQEAEVEQWRKDMRRWEELTKE